jgi:hypothetical protein
MTTKWSTRAFNKSSNMDELFKDEFAVILMQGKNTFGDKIYTYVKVGMSEIKNLYAAMQSGQNFNPSDFGSVVAAGKGEPPPEVRAEMNSTYKMLEPVKPASFPSATAQAISTEKKEWDEY